MLSGLVWYTLEKCEMSRLYTDGRTHTQWKIVHYSVWEESAKMYFKETAHLHKVSLI